MMKKDFLGHPWHDAEILGIEIDRRMPGDNDVIDIAVRWPDGKEGAVQFSNCFGATLQMNFGVCATESIFSVAYVEDREDVFEVRRRWEALGVDMADVVCFEIETNSTGSNIRVYARDCVVRVL